MKILNTPNNIQRVKNEIAQHYAFGKPLTDAEISALCGRFSVATDAKEVSLYIKIAEPHGDRPVNLSENSNLKPTSPP